MKRISGWLLLSLAIITLDQLTKYAISEQLSLYQSLAVFPGFKLTLVHNTGAAFGFLNQAGGWQTWFFIILTSGISLFILIWMHQLSERKRCLSAALACVLGGAAGNLLDRIIHGYVIDFIEVSLSFLPWQIFNPWPIFNIADSAIFIGSMLLLIDMIWGNDRT